MKLATDQERLTNDNWPRVTGDLATDNCPRTTDQAQRSIGDWWEFVMGEFVIDKP